MKSSSIMECVYAVLYFWSHHMIYTWHRCTALQSNELEVSSAGHSLMSSAECLPQSVHASLDGEEGYTESQQHLRWARRQRLLDDTLRMTSCPPPNRTICHIVDCWWPSVQCVFWRMSVRFPSVHFLLNFTAVHLCLCTRHFMCLVDCIAGS